MRLKTELNVAWPRYKRRDGKRGNLTNPIHFIKDIQRLTETSGTSYCLSACVSGSAKLKVNDKSGD